MCTVGLLAAVAFVCYTGIEVLENWHMTPFEQISWVVFCITVGTILIRAGFIINGG